jgi:hypothetical protein
MKKLFLLVISLAVALCFGEASLLAQRGGGGGGHGAAGGGGMRMGSNAGMGGMDRGGMDRGSNSMGRAGNSTGMSRSGSSLGKQSPTEILSRNTHLSSRLQSLLPPGTNLNKAASGFKNLGQFVAAVHVSHNLGIPFSSLKSKMISGDSLGKAIHTLNPNVNAKAEAKKADKQSKRDLDVEASKSSHNS